VQQQPWIDAAAAAGHHQSLERREAHRGVDAARLALGIDFDRAEGAAGAELAADQAADVWISGRDRFAHVLVVEAVEAKAAQALLAPACWDGVGGGGFAEAGVEGGVEAGPLFDGAALQLALQLALQPVDCLQRWAVVQRGQGHQIFQLRQHLRAQQGGSAEVGTTVHDPVNYKLG